ncbi:unnamed protein product [Prorocentrum cordatum]|uniref:Uncharacterized protein n=1 Tax=Prorocentrum cordatum TaxID=2364126 RepID=A0ABN9SIZ8_9DINO|nr:unnamed protein product [Polarella glacialis]
MKYETFVLLNKSEISFYDSTCEGAADGKPQLAFRVLRDAGTTQLQWALETIRYQSTRLPPSLLAHKTGSRCAEAQSPPRQPPGCLAQARAVDACEGEFPPL